MCQEAHAVGAVLVALPTLVLHHVPLDVEPLLVQGVQQEAHPVGLQPEGKLQVVGGDVFPVVGAVRSGGTVQVCAGLLEGVEVAVVVVTGALEHHVFEEVGEAGAAYFLILGADMVPDVDRHQRNRVVFVEDDVEAVGQSELFKRYGDHV